jgi:tetratricopeptide (TPR) repeat protein
VGTVLGSIGLAAHAQVDDSAEVARLLKAGQVDQANSKADSLLATRPRDAQLRFLKGLILIEQSKPNDAINTFVKLTEDFPELPEPYNNLAVLYASQGQLDKARASLEMAIRTHPTYATAHENLGDIYAKLASQAYDKALQLDASSSATQSKLALVRELIGAKPRQLPVGKTPSPTQVGQVSEPTFANNKPSAPEIKAVEPPRPIGKITPAATATGAEDDEVVNTIRNWAKAWAKQDVDGYLAFYAKDFETPKNLDRKRWEEDRRARISGKSKIEVMIESPLVSVNRDTATVKFKQIYKSDQLKSTGTKILTLVNKDGKWLIKQEKAGA